MKNVCQTCLFDLEYGLPVQVGTRRLALFGRARSSKVRCRSASSATPVPGTVFQGGFQEPLAASPSRCALCARTPSAHALAPVIARTVAGGDPVVLYLFLRQGDVR